MSKSSVDSSKHARGERPLESPIEAAICRHVLSLIGRPTDFLRISVRHVTIEGYRVNILAGADLSSARIAHSYFVQAGEDGLVTASSPALVKLYAKEM